MRVWVESFSDARYGSPAAGKIHVIDSVVKAINFTSIVLKQILYFIGFIVFGFLSFDRNTNVT